MNPGTEIYKVQIPLSTNAKEPTAFLYNRERSKEFFLPITPDLLRWMDGKPKKFAYAFVQGENIVIDAEAPWQDW